MAGLEQGTVELESMVAAAASPCRIAFVGFSDFERSTLAAFFRLSAAGARGFVQVASAADADLLVADAEQAGALRSVIDEGRVGDAVFIGGLAPEGAVARLARPIDPVLIVRELERQVALRQGAAAAERAVVAGGPPASSVAPPLVATPIADPASRIAPSSGPQRARAKDEATSITTDERLALVVDDSATARRFLTQALSRLGYRVHAHANGEEALEAAARERYALATVDVALGPPGRLDGWQVCRALKAQVPAPAVFFITSRQAESDRVRGSLAGGDVYLQKPLTEADFARAVQAHEAAVRR